MTNLKAGEKVNLSVIMHPTPYDQISSRQLNLLYVLIAQKCFYYYYFFRSVYGAFFKPNIQRCPSCVCRFLSTAFVFLMAPRNFAMKWKTLFLMTTGVSVSLLWRKSQLLPVFLKKNTSRPITLSCPPWLTVLPIWLEQWKMFAHLYTSGIKLKMKAVFIWHCHDQSHGRFEMNQS